jgi:hypothetical protein
MWGALSDERTGLSFTMYNVQYINILHVILCIHTHTHTHTLTLSLSFTHTHTHTHTHSHTHTLIQAQAIFRVCYNLPHGPHRKHLPSTLTCVVITTLPSTGHPIVAYSLPRDVFTSLLPSNASQYFCSLPLPYFILWFISIKGM